tara:strand:- start:11993 stop:12151 length:159 start_codon:yes stop_codon:yes gene_type:complete
MEYIKNAIIKIFKIRANQNYVLIIPKKFKNKKKYLKFIKKTNTFITTNVKYD